MGRIERIVVDMGTSIEPFRDRQELLAQRLAIENRADVKYLFNGYAYLVTLEEAIDAHSTHQVGQRLEELMKDLKKDAKELLEKERDLERGTKKLLGKEVFFKEEIEKEKKYAKLAKEINNC